MTKTCKVFLTWSVIVFILLLWVAGTGLVLKYGKKPGSDVPPLISPQELAPFGITLPETTYCLRYYNADGGRCTRYRDYFLFSESDILIEEEVKKKMGVNEYTYQYGDPDAADRLHRFYEEVTPKYRKYFPDGKDEIHEYFYDVYLRLFKTEKGSYLRFVDYVP